MPYLLANLFGIGAACVVNFVLNDLWTYRQVRTQSMDPETKQPERAPMAMPLTVSGLVLGFCTYLQGLGSLHILRNGDELVYMQITRVTGMAGQWLPPAGHPGHAGHQTTAFVLAGAGEHELGGSAGRWWRYAGPAWRGPSVRRCSAVCWVGNCPVVTCIKGALAALFYLAFFSTYRYGRPYLTNPPETFWVFACFFTMLWWKPRSFDSRFLFPTILGVLAGMALLTKSFAQLFPVGVGLSCWHLHVRGWRVASFVRNSLPGIVWTALLSLGMFSLWFVFDPEPAVIWHEFVMGENMGKMTGSAGSWLKGFLWSGDTVWSLGGSWFFNAGLLAFPLFGLMVECWKHRRALSHEERLLWIWVLAIFFVFCIPSQRSGRYLLEGMPALAVLLATRCHYLKRYVFVLSLACTVAVLLSTGMDVVVAGT